MNIVYNSLFFKLLKISNSHDLRTESRAIGITASKLNFYAKEGVYPDNKDEHKLLTHLNITSDELHLALGILDIRIKNMISSRYKEVMSLIQVGCTSTNNQEEQSVKLPQKVFSTDLGVLYQGDCLSAMDSIEPESIDLIFADPPFNLGKIYESGINDSISKHEYIEWTEKWVSKCVNLLAVGGSLFIWNLPKWNTYTAEILNRNLICKHWIATDIKYRLPIKNRLYPSHYSLLYYTKGDKSGTFNEQRLPLEVCRHCGGDIRDYGGYKDKLNVAGINISDVWYDIPPVRHSKYKNRDSNELSLKLLERIISIASNEGDLVFDPFGGSGTTYIASEILNRRWIGVEIGNTDCIIERFNDLDSQREQITKIQSNNNVLFTDKVRKKRKENGFWLPETLKK